MEGKPMAHRRLIASATILTLAVAGCPDTSRDFDFDDDGWDDDVDCAPEDASIHPDADDPYGDGVDQNCDQADGVDSDGDGYPSNVNPTDPAWDCNDNEATIHPGADDPHGDGVETNCDGVDGADVDGDGYPGNAAEDHIDFDCDDADAEVNSGATETCSDGVDTDCDGLVDLFDDDCQATGEMALVEAGTFTMGSPEEEIGHEPDEELHEVTLTRGLYVSTYEMTQARFEELMTWNPSDCDSGCGDDHPVQMVSWFDAVAFANEASASVGLPACYEMADVVCEDGTSVGTDYMACMNDTQSGIEVADVTLNGASTPYNCEGYRLPTEAEWEFAARGSLSEASFPNGGNLYAGDSGNCDGSLQLDDGSELDDQTWYCGNAAGVAHVVGELDENGYGLSDMSGNVFEWCFDWYEDYPGDEIDPSGPISGTIRSSRGGSWFLNPRYTRVAYRSYGEPGFRNDRLGFRLVKSYP